MSTYTITPQHYSLMGGEIGATSYRVARRLAAYYRDDYHQGVTIERDGVVIDKWQRSEDGDGSKWYRVNY